VVAGGAADIEEREGGGVEEAEDGGGADEADAVLFPNARASFWKAANVFPLDGGLMAPTIPIGQWPVC